PQGRVLVVDDDEHLRKLCQTVLQSAGFTTAAAASGLEALARVQIEPFDLILLDVVLPDLSGLEVLQRLRQTPVCAETQGVGVSGRSGGLRPEELPGLQAVGANDILTKPFKPEQLAAKAKAARSGEPEPAAAPAGSVAARRASVAHRAVQQAVQTRDGLAL